MANAPHSFWAYYKSVKQSIDKDDLKWARDNLMLACFIPLIPTLLALLIYGIIPEPKTFIFTLWVYAVLLTIFVVVILVRAPWRFHRDRTEEHNKELELHTNQYNQELELRNLAESQLLKQLDDQRLRADAAEKRLYDGRPILILKVLTQPTWKTSNPTGQDIFSLTNVGLRPARFVRINSVKSNKKNYEITFGSIPALQSSQEVPIEFCIGPNVQDQRMLCAFLEDNEEDTSITWWDLEILYRDTDEVTQTELTRLVFDSESKSIFVTPVPRTERTN
ncbi:MAG: hypothetical protein WCC22_04395 [Terriglobales bacterium]